MDEIVYWIWLSSACTPDSATFPKLLERFSGAKEVYEADSDEIVKCIGRRATDREKLIHKNLNGAVKIYEFCKKHNVGLLPYCSENYPESLRRITSPPILLYYRGVLPDFNKEFFVASVGTRSISDYGRRSAFKVSFDLSMAGAVVVSGMAVGIDGVSHAGALSAGGVTVAVIGSGIDVCYPKQHLRLAREIVKKGCVITEFAPGTPPDKFNFPKRNRIISGLCAATLVIEGRERSGSLITARCAKEQGRVVYALPGNVGTENSQVTNLLIKDGARLFTCAEDIINDFRDTYGGQLNPFKLKEKMGVDMMAQLSALEVVANCPTDKIFSSFPSEKKQTSAPEPKASPEPITEEPLPKEEPTLPAFDKKTLAVYKRIPLGAEVEIESLVDSEMNLRDVMKAILKLEMASFVVVLPGERVARKTK